MRGVLIVLMGMTAAVQMLQAKTALGVENGRLASCPVSPNCVLTQAEQKDKKHYISPIKYTVSKEKAMEAVLRVIQDTPKTKIIQTNLNYIYAEFRTPLMNFVDDVEFYFPDDEPVIHFRSASRVGYGDMGTNRKRMEKIRVEFENLIEGQN